ncbi:unnamed protein product [marine sediment metagenome]|uniref:DNA primase/polymerase bifunctional N-terminal domain-containing protein n=1 Tax=marine sediment metagenome TaxID=412755 RepID=X1RET5_9ZZZZ
MEVKTLQKISGIFGQPVIPLCSPDGNGGCRCTSHFPKCTSPGKRALLKGWMEPNFQLSPEALERYARVGVNWGLRLGDGLVELDFDDPAKYMEFTASHTLPEDVPVILSGRKGGGYKVILRAKKPPPKNFPHDGFEVRSKGLLVIPDSLHKSGNRYRWLSINGHIPEVDLEELLGVNFDDIQGPKQSAEGRPLNTKQQQAVEKALLEYLPGAQNINGELAGYLDTDSQSKAHIKVNIEKGIYYDFRLSEGGTIKDLLRRIGAPLPPELGGMGENAVPEYFPIWAIDRRWFEDWHCGQLVVVARYDGVPAWSGKAFCMSWGCPECSIRLKNILKARLKPLPALEVWKAPIHAAEKLSRIRRANKAFHYARALNSDSEYALVRSEDSMNAELLANGFAFSELSPQDAIDGLSHALVGRRKRRFIPSRNFWDVGINNITLPAECKNTNSNKKAKPPLTEQDKRVEELLRKDLTLGQITKELRVLRGQVQASLQNIDLPGLFSELKGEGGPEHFNATQCYDLLNQGNSGWDLDSKPALTLTQAIARYEEIYAKAVAGPEAKTNKGEEEMEQSDFDIVVLDDNYNDVLGRLEALGFSMKDTGGGESHRLRHPRGRDAPRVDPDELGEVVQVITFG